MEAGVPRSITIRVHVPERGWRFHGHFQLSKQGSRASRGFVGHPEAELPGDPSYDRHEGTESWFSEGHPVAPAALARRSHGQRVHAGTARERATNGGNGLRSTYQWSRFPNGDLRIAIKCYQSLFETACKLLILWWAQQDSNLRLPPCEGGTLPLSYAPWEPDCRLG
jgi:hypothetical protein